MRCVQGKLYARAYSLQASKLPSCPKMDVIVLIIPAFLAESCGDLSISILIILLLPPDTIFSNTIMNKAALCIQIYTYLYSIDRQAGRQAERQAGHDRRGVACVACRGIALRCVAVRCDALRCVATRCVALRCVAWHGVTLRCVAWRGVQNLSSHHGLLWVGSNASSTLT